MATRDIYETGFNESDGRTLTNADCPECEGGLETEGGETCCVDCGLIVNDYRLDHSATKRDFDGEEAGRERTGAPLTAALHDHGNSSEIGWRNRDAKGEWILPREATATQAAPSGAQPGTMELEGRTNLALGFGEITRIGGQLKLSWSVKEEASELLRKAQRENLLQGRSIETIAAGSVYAVCRLRGVTRTKQDIAEVARVPEAKVIHGYMVLKREPKLQTQLLRPQLLVPHFARECGASTRLTQRALELTELAEEAGIANGRNPSVIAAACLYQAGRELGVQYTQSELAKIADVASATLRERYYEIRLC